MDINWLGAQLVFEVRDWCWNWILRCTGFLPTAKHARLQPKISTKLTYPLAGANRIKLGNSTTKVTRGSGIRTSDRLGNKRLIHLITSSKISTVHIEVLSKLNWWTLVVPIRITNSVNKCILVGRGELGSLWVVNSILCFHSANQFDRNRVDDLLHR